MSGMIPELDHGPGDVWASDRAAPGNLADAFEGNVRSPPRAAVARPAAARSCREERTGRGTGQPRLGPVEQVGEQVQTDDLPVLLDAAGQLTPGTSVSPGGRAATAFGPAGRAVVVSQRDHVETRRPRRAHQLGRCQRPVGGGGVGMQVDAHQGRSYVGLQHTGERASELLLLLERLQGGAAPLGQEPVGRRATIVTSHGSEVSSSPSA